MRSFDVAVLGTSLFARAVAAECLRAGARVLVLGECDRPGVSAFRTEENGVCTEHVCPCTQDWSGIAGVPFVITPAIGDELVSTAHRLAGNMAAGQTLVLFPGYFMAGTTADIFREARNTGVRICEMTSAPVVCDTSPDGTIRIRKRKQKLKFAVHGKNRDESDVPDLVSLLPMLAPARSTVETSLENINAILHPLPVLLNLVAVQRAPEAFLHFLDGVNEEVSRLLHLMDDERLEVGKALGLELEPTLGQLKSYYGENRATTIHEYIRSPECPYRDVRGFGLASRYIRLDVPHLVVNTARIARKHGVPTPLYDACIALADPFLR